MLPAAETCRRVGAAAEELGLMRPSYGHVRRIVRVERRRRELRARQRKVLAGRGCRPRRGARPERRPGARAAARAPARRGACVTGTQGVRAAGSSARGGAAGYWAWTSQPRTISASTASVTNCVAWTAFANVYGPGLDRLAGIGGRRRGRPRPRRCTSRRGRPRGAPRPTGRPCARGGRRARALGLRRPSSRRRVRGGLGDRLAVDEAARARARPRPTA